MARILAIDYGTKRTGIAVTDELQLIAGALDTVKTSELMSYLGSYVEKENVERVIIGEPRQTNGMPSENLRGVLNFEKQWGKRFPAIPIEGIDERFTSVIAHRVMLDAGLHKKERQNKGLVDKISATIILQDYLESKKR